MLVCCKSFIYDLIVNIDTYPMLVTLALLGKQKYILLLLPGSNIRIIKK